MASEKHSEAEKNKWIHTNWLWLRVFLDFTPSYWLAGLIALGVVGDG